jgi:hypothetical protein
VSTPVLLYALNPPEIKDTPKAPEQAKKRLQELGPLTRWVAQGGGRAGQGTATVQQLRWSALQALAPGTTWHGSPGQMLSGTAPPALLHAVPTLSRHGCTHTLLASPHVLLLLPHATGTLRPSSPDDTQTTMPHMPGCSQCLHHLPTHSLTHALLTPPPTAPPHSDEAIMMGTILLAVTMWVFGDVIGVAPVLAALMGLCGLLFTGGCLSLSLSCMCWR